MAKLSVSKTHKVDKLHLPDAWSVVTINVIDHGDGKTTLAVGRVTSTDAMVLHLHECEFNDMLYTQRTRLMDIIKESDKTTKDGANAKSDSAKRKWWKKV